jgi:hypothetical protein
MAANEAYRVVRITICWRADEAREPAMLRCATLVLLTMATTGAALAADQIVVRHGKRDARHQLPAGLPRPHYKYKTTITYGAPVAPPPVYADRDPDVLFTPVVPYVAVVHAPLLPGSSTLPGYYGSTYSYDYQGPYYGGPYVSYWDRLPYACGVYGYC